MMRLRTNKTLFIVSLLLCICSSQSLAIDDTKFRDLNASLLDKIIIPAYEDLYQSAIALNQQSVESCRLPNKVNFNRLKKSFETYVNSWMGIEFFRSGPVEYQYRQNRIQYWPDKHGVVGRQLRQLLAGQDVTLLNNASFPKLSAGVQGITALDVLLYEEKAFALFMNKTTTGQFRCHLIEAISHNQQAMLRELLDDWQRKEGGYRNLLLGEEAGSQDPQDIGIDILRLLYGEILAVKELKLGRPLDKSIDKARPRRAELWRSELSQSSMRRNLAAVAQFFNPGSTTDNFYNLENKARNQSIAQQIYQLLEQSRVLLEELSLPVNQSVSDATNRKVLLSLVGNLGEVADKIERYTSTVYQSPLGFNSFDGD